MKFYAKLAYRLFGELALKLVPYVSALKVLLKKAGLRISIQEYLSMALLTCFLVFSVECVCLTFIFAVLTGRVFFSLLLSFLASVLLSSMLFILFLRWPAVLVSSRAEQIDRCLPFASLYLSTIAGSKLPLSHVFKTFARFKLYPAVEEEVKRMVHDVEVFGYDVDSALERAIARTPSKQWEELLWGIYSTRTAGGDVATYLAEKSNSIFTEHRRKVAEYAKNLVLIVEMYMIAAVLGSLFFVVLTAVLAGIAGVGPTLLFIQFFLVIFLLPSVAAIFIWIIKTMAPSVE